MTIVRAALTQTRNAYADMPANVSDLERLSDRLPDVRNANLDHHADLAAAAAREGARVIGFGELFTGPYFALHRASLWFGLAESAEDGPTVRRCQDIARRHNLVVVAPVYELAPSGERFNTAIVIDADGELLGSYRKVHIPEGGNETASFHETYYYQRSDGKMGRGPRVFGHPYFPVFETRVGKIGVSICYDRHFEGVISSLARGGAEIVFSPAVTFGEKSRRFWPIECAADAVRHRVYIGVSNRCGPEVPFGVDYFGESHFVGPDGVLANHSPHPELILSDLDLGSRRGEDSAGWNFPRDTRPELHR